MVSVTYDPEAKALYISMDKGNRVAKTIPAGGDRFVDLDENGQLLGIEMLFSQEMPQEAVDAIINTDENEIVVLNH